ncbi:2278_t:CDS:2 [Funneliformis geosporum]|uniref:8772_t:CDS:1 n=1 Tax=Funneliformis geosporum TaxID=1117311 RepID=A0A9W4T132_9GLOM|nr:2278_t:CDS:2 [Funneliformis geosporum]CAI2188641.1 8772_t:CDS:2 [Funneliformis geosporum]
MSEEDYFNEDQIKVLKAFFSTFIAELDDDETRELISTSCSVNNKENLSSIKSFAKFDLSSSYPEFLEYFMESLINFTTEDKLSKIRFILKLLSIRLSAYLLTGHFKPFYELTRKQREKVIQTWAISSSLFRRLYHNFALLITGSFWLNPPTEITNTIGYPVTDPEINSEKFTSKSFPIYDFIEIPAEGCELEFDVIVIGSGAGGGVIAAELAKAGNSVLILEKGKYYHQSELTMRANDGLKNLYERKGVMISEDDSIAVLSGSTFGGGTVVNWSASVRPQDFVRKEWAKPGLDYFLSDEFNDALDYVEGRMGVSASQVTHNEQNKILIDGCKNLGIHNDIVAQNSGGHAHSCGWCGYGCEWLEKQSTLMTFLQDARDSGAKFIQDCFVEKILIKNGKANGVEALVSGDKRLMVSAKIVVVSAGSIHSPAILLRSGITNQNLGKHLHIHPACETYGIFPDREVKGYDGTSICSEKENINGKGYGVRIETPEHDKHSLLQGIILSLKILVSAGAKRVGTAQAGIEDFVVNELGNVEDETFLEYLEKVEEIGLTENRTFIGTTHQIGTCRMGDHPLNSVTLFVSAQELPPTKLDFHTVKIPKYASWYKCNTLSTEFMSYAIKLASNYAQVDPINYGGKYIFDDQPELNNSFYGKYGKGFVARATNRTDYIIVSLCGDIGPNGSFIGVSYSCGRVFTSPPGTWCLIIYNPFFNDQKLDVVLSFTESVFVDGSYRKDQNETITIAKEIRTFKS